ncbi:MAG TPA: class I SAM-dependent methyltransferase [Brumimicrobium sp.]|nr:class I SAM-dependent methyltransferase [Brumimicrobium sp.]
MKNFWDERYSSAEFAYGEEPNEYFKAQLSKLESGKILLPGDGEGRNGVSAAKFGWEVESFDISSEGKKKADALAEKHGLTINYQVGGLEDLSYKTNYFDAIALIFTHFNPAIRANYRKKFIELLKPGGIIIFESFSTKHLTYSAENPKVGGPKDVSLLTTLKQVEEEFAGLDIIELYQTEAIFNEGDFHVGKGDVVRFLGRKKA